MNFEHLVAHGDRTRKHRRRTLTSRPWPRLRIPVFFALAFVALLTVFPLSMPTPIEIGGSIIGGIWNVVTWLNAFGLFLGVVLGVGAMFVYPKVKANYGTQIRGYWRDAKYYTKDHTRHIVIGLVLAFGAFVWTYLSPLAHNLCVNFWNKALVPLWKNFVVAEVWNDHIVPFWNEQAWPFLVFVRENWGWFAGGAVIAAFIIVAVVFIVKLNRRLNAAEQDARSANTRADTAEQNWHSLGAELRNLREQTLPRLSQEQVPAPLRRSPVSNGMPMPTRRAPQVHEG